MNVNIEIDNEIEKYKNDLMQIQEEINKLEAKKAELLKLGLRLEGIIAFLTKLKDDNNKSESSDK